MSVLNFWQSDNDSAVVVVDTLSTRGAEVSKMVCIPHLGAVLGFRGQVGVGISVVAQVLLREAANFEDLEHELPSIVDSARAWVTEQEKFLAAHFAVTVQDLRTDPRFGNGQGDSWGLDEVLLVGPSKAAGCIRSTHVKRHEVGGQLRVGRDLELLVGPPSESLIASAAADLSSDAGVLEFVRRQVRTCAQGMNGYGGRAIVARIGRSGVSIRDVGPIEPAATKQVPGG